MTHGQTAQSRIERVDLGVLATWSMILLHTSCLLVFVVGVTRAAVAVCFLFYWARVLGITLGFHRCLAHRTFSTSRAFQFLLAWLGTSAMQRGPLWFVALHRVHHRNADTEGDVHSPRRGIWWAHIGWVLCRKYEDANLSEVRDLSLFPELRWLDRFFLAPPLALAATAAVLGMVLPGTSALQMLVWGFSISTVLVYHSTFAVNSVGHRYGSRPFETKDDSRNNLFIAAIMMGEGFHNNHHRFPGSARLGFEPWQIDTGYWALVLLKKLGFIWNMRTTQPLPSSKG